MTLQPDPTRICMSILHRVKTLRTLLLVFAVAGAGCGVPQSPNQVSDIEIGVYQAGVLHGCKTGGLNRGGKPENVELFCNCMIDVLKTDVSHSDWQLAYMYARQGNHDGEKKVMFAHMDKVRTCKTLEH
jgi:hypothetical protein